MKTSKLLIGCFALVAVAQLTVPAWMIVSHERTLLTGKVFKFRTAPVDPYDAFRGRYVRACNRTDAVADPCGGAVEERAGSFRVDRDGYDRLLEVGRVPARPGPTAGRT